MSERKTVLGITYRAFKPREDGSLTWLEQGRLLRLVKRFIKKYPEKYDQMSVCLSPACIAGWCVLLVSESKRRNPLDFALDEGARLFGHKDWQSIWLFQGGFDGQMGEYSEHLEDPAQRGCAAIDLWLKENGL